MGEDSDGSPSIDEEILRYLAGALADQPEVSGTSLFPTNKQESLLSSFDTEYYPASIEDVWLELRVYTDGDFHVSYIEIYVGERRRCRWDRYDQDHNAWGHFHTFGSVEILTRRHVLIRLRSVQKLDSANGF